jgi:hypothetical protein
VPRPAGGAGELARLAPQALVGRVLRSHGGDRLGRVERVCEGRDGGIEALVVRYGGVLGLGASRVVLGPDEVEVVRTGHAGPRTGAIELRTALGIDDLDARPEADPDADAATGHPPDPDPDAPRR